MLDETIKAVKDAEQKSGMLVQEAELRAAEIVAEAKKEAAGWEEQQIREAREELYDRIVNPALLVRRLSVTAGHVERDLAVCVFAGISSLKVCSAPVLSTALI